MARRVDRGRRHRGILPGRTATRRPDPPDHERLGHRDSRHGRGHRRVHPLRSSGAPVVAGGGVRSGHRPHRCLRGRPHQGDHLLRHRGMGSRVHPLPALHAGCLGSRYGLPPPERPPRRADHRVADHPGDRQPPGEHRARDHPLLRPAPRRGALGHPRGAGPRRAHAGSGRARPLAPRRRDRGCRPLRRDARGGTSQDDGRAPIEAMP